MTCGSLKGPPSLLGKSMHCSLKHRSEVRVTEPTFLTRAAGTKTFGVTTVNFTIDIKKTRSGQEESQMTAFLFAREFVETTFAYNSPVYC